jgi:hypothetical protein
MRELALQDFAGADIDAAVIETYPLVMRALREQAEDPAARNLHRSGL